MPFLSFFHSSLIFLTLKRTPPHPSGGQAQLVSARLVCGKASLHVKKPLRIGCVKEHRTLFIAADNDMENRLEQTNPPPSALRRFRCDELKYALSILRAAHCGRVCPEDREAFASCKSHT